MKLKYIDSIRGIAILMVVLVHTSAVVIGLNPITKLIASYGQMGVQLFFIASAYTLCLSASYREKENNKLSKYAIRRIFRIAPLYYLGIMVYFILPMIKLIVTNANIIIPSQYSFKNIISNILFVHGFYEPGNNSIVPGGWSIGTEMAFYVIFPSLYFIASKKLNESFRNVAVWIFFGLFTSQIILMFLELNGTKMINNSFIYYNLVNQIPVFFIGIGYYFINPKENLQHNWIIDLGAFILFTAISMYLFLINIDYLFSVVPFISGLSFIFLIEVFRKLEFLNLNLIGRIGKVSFSIYIIHFSIVYKVPLFLSPIFSKFLNSEFLLILGFIISAVGSFCLALVLEKYIEKPFVKLGKKIILGMDRSDLKQSA